MAGISTKFFASPWVTQVCRRVANDYSLKVLATEIISVNLPRIAIIRTKDEAADTAVNEIGNTIGFAGIVFGGGALLQKYLNQFTNLVRRHGNDIILTPQARMMKSLFLIPALFGFMTAMPFIRNAFTAWRAGTTDFKTLVTKKKQNEALPPIEVRRKDPKLREYIGKALQRGLTIFISGFALGGLGFLWARSQGKFRLFSTPEMLIPALQGKKLGQWLQNKLMLQGQRATGYGDWHGTYLWGLPAYIGWITASRDRYEVLEWAVKALDFMLIYRYAQAGVEKVLSHKTAEFAKTVTSLYPLQNGKHVFDYNTFGRSVKDTFKPAIAFENKKMLGGIGLTILLLATAPALLNIFLTNLRIKRHEAKVREDAQIEAELRLKKSLNIPLISPLVNPWNTNYASINPDEFDISMA